MKHLGSDLVIRPRGSDLGAMTKRFELPRQILKDQQWVDTVYSVVPEVSAVGGYHHMINYC